MTLIWSRCGIALPRCNCEAVVIYNDPATRNLKKIAVVLTRLTPLRAFLSGPRASGSALSLLGPP